MEPGERGGEQDDKPAETGPTRLGPLTRRGALLGMGAVAGIAAVDVGGFAYAGGWLRPDALTPPRFTDRFEHVYGRHDGFRRNHAKGLSATGSFVSNGAGAAVCRAAVFRAGNVPVIGRFSLSGGLPYQPDKPDTIRGLALDAVQMLATGTTQGDVLVPGFASMVHGRLGGGQVYVRSLVRELSRRGRKVSVIAHEAGRADESSI